MTPPDDLSQNPFEAFANDAKSPRQRAYEQRKAAKLTMTPAEAERQRAPTPADKRLREKHTLATEYRRWKAEQLRELLAGPHGRAIVELRKFIRRLGIADAPALMAHVRSLSWLFQIAPERRYQVRSMISYGIVRLRLRNGFCAFDDAIPFASEDPDASTLLLEYLA